ncbi:MAG: DUF547 domain-containing protein [Phenylobacterium sp.]|uniref:DUF547 domain-containing protein n=1 Tax=Phenylobacterium sp. TaxID=1871053 RepID=UPI00391F44A5
MACRRTRRCSNLPGDHRARLLPPGPADFAPAWRDPRVHYAVNCASFSCPDLPRRAWRGAGLQAALDEAARIYVNHPRAVRFEGDALVVSSIYRWYAEDFGSSDAAVIAHLARFARPPLAARLKASRRIARTTYDWSLNAVRTAG